jgi:hypothetical protein
MRTYPLLLCLLATSYAYAGHSDAGAQPVATTFAMNSVSSSETDFPARTAPIVAKRRIAAKARASFPDISRGVVSEMKATSAFVKNHADTETSDGWLIALTALGLVALQLRRKHNSLPQRRIAPYG